jgi:ABC-2 type transport system permease protein
MNKNIVLAVARRDLKSWFGNPAGYVFILLFVSVSCIALMWTGTFFTNNLANLDAWNGSFPAIAVFFVAASTMGMWTSERANGTQELLFTLPGRDFDLQLGKFLAGVGVYTISLAFTLPLPLALSFLGSPDWGQLFANYVGFWLFGVMLVSVSMIGSQLTQNATVAFIVSAILCLVVVFLGWVMGWLGYPGWNTNGPLGQFGEFARGMLPFSGLLLFVGLTITFFYLGLALLARRHWRDGTQGLHTTVRFVGGAVAALSLTIIATHVLPRLDATVEGIHSLGDESKKLLAGLDANKPVFVTAYVSEDVPEQFVQQRRLLLNLLDQFDRIGGGAVEKRIVLPKPYSPEARDAEKNFGIRPQLVTSQTPGGGLTESQLFLGFVVQCGTEEVVTPFLEPAVPLEYELTRSIRVVANAGRKKVGLLKTDVELGGGFDFQNFRQKQRWQIADELQQQYKIENVDADKDYPEGLDCLVVPQASSLVQEQMDRLKAWIEAGNPTLLLEDPAPLDAWGTAADDQKGGARNMMMGGGGGPQKGAFDGLLSALAITVPKGEVVWDSSSRSFPGGRLPEEFVFVSGPGVAEDSPISKGLQNVVMLMAGHVQAQKRDGFTVTPLLKSVDPSLSRAPNGIVPKLELFQFDPFGGGPAINPYRQRERRNDEFVLAARIEGKPAEGKSKGVNAIYVADLDLIGNQFFQIRRQMADPNLRFDNVTFVLNCIDSLVGDESLIELRKRRPKLRKLDAVEMAQRDFEEKWTEQKGAAEAAAKKELDEAQKRLDDAVAKIRDDGNLDEQAKEVMIVQKQQQENRRFELAKAKIEDEKKMKIEEAAHEREEARDRIRNGYRGITLVLAALPGLLLGFVTLIRRSSRAAAIVPQNRKVAGGAK